MLTNFVIDKNNIPIADPELLKHLGFCPTTFLEYGLYTFSAIDPNDIYASIDSFIYELLEVFDDHSLEFLYDIEERLINIYLNQWVYLNNLIGYYVDRLHSKDNFLNYVNVDGKIIPSSYVITIEFLEC
jgi:hypothetical protein